MKMNMGLLAFTPLILLVLTQITTCSSPTTIIKDWPYTKFSNLRSHYPCFCSFTDAVFKWKEEKFYFKHDGDGDKLKAPCFALDRVWDVENDPAMSDVTCDITYDIGYVFTIYYFGKGSNYYHLFYDLAIPLYSEVYHGKTREELSEKTMAFMPTVETSRMNKVNWDTDAFILPQDGKYWNQIARTIAGKYDYLPLDRNLIKQKKNICFKEVKFGAPGVDFTDKSIINGISSYFVKQLKVKRVPFRKHKVGIINRTNRRRILNEAELLAAIKPKYDAELVVLSGRRVKDQVELMQQYTVLVGINGAGLMNALFLPPYAVCIQLVPYKAKVNYVQYGDLLKARGPYMEWHNEHENLTVTGQGDEFNSRADTIVHVEEFKSLIDKAIEKVDTYLKLYIKKDKKDEL